MRLRATRLTAIATAVRRLFNPASLFASGAPGVWYDLSLTDGTLFQDAAGTTPVTAVEQPVGLVLDKSKGLVLGPELVTNGTFDTDAGWSLGTGWSITEGQLVGSNVTNYQAIFDIGAVAGKIYAITVDVSARTAGTISISIGNAFNSNDRLVASSKGSYRAFVKSVGASAAMFIYPSGGFTGAIDNISVRELPGNHAFQTTSANRPVLSARYNLLTKTEQFDDAVWTKANATVTANATTAPDGTLTADKLKETSVTGVHTLSVPLAIPANTKVTVSVALKAAERSFALIGDSADAVTVNLTTGVASRAVGTLIADVTSTFLSNGWFRISYTITKASGADLYFYSSIDGVHANRSFAGTTDYGIYIWNPDLRVSNDGVGLPPYQRVNTATDYDTVGFPLYLRFNGSTQFLQTNSIDFSSTDKVLVAAGVRKLSDAAQGAIAELSNDPLNLNGIFILNGPQSVNEYFWRSRGTAVSSAVIDSAEFLAPTTNVITGLGDISGDQAILRVNGTQAAISTADQGTGNYGKHPLYIGARADTALFFNGRLYSLIIAGIKPTDAQILGVETYINSLTKAF